jgi:putative membrane protein
MKIKGVFVLFVILIILIFCGFVGSQNSHQVLVNYLIAETQMRVSILMAINLLVGVLITLVALSWYVLRLKWRVRSLERQHKKLTKDQKV